MLSSFRQNLLGCVRNSTRARKTCRETSKSHQILDVSYNIYKSKHPNGCFCFWKEWFPKPEQRRIFRTPKETSTGSPRDTCTRGAVDYRFLSVLTKILKHPKWVLFLCCFPHSGNSCCLRQWYCLRSDIAYAVILLTQWYLALPSYGFFKKTKVNGTHVSAVFAWKM